MRQMATITEPILASKELFGQASEQLQYHKTSCTVRFVGHVKAHFLGDGKNIRVRADEGQVKGGKHTPVSSFQPEQVAASLSM